MSLRYPVPTKTSPLRATPSKKASTHKRHAYVYIKTQTQICIHTHTYIHIYIHTCMHTHTNIHTQTPLPCANSQLESERSQMPRIYAYTHIHICIHSYIPTQTPLPCANCSTSANTPKRHSQNRRRQQLKSKTSLMALIFTPMSRVQSSRSCVVTFSAPRWIPSTACYAMPNCKRIR